MRGRGTRRIRSVLVAFGLLLAVVLVRPAIAQELLGLAGAPEAPPERPIPVTRAPGEDRLLAKRLTEIFAEVDGLEEVEVEARSGVVVLSGEAQSSEAHQKAVRIAGQLDGVIEVKDEIRDARDVEARLGPVLGVLQDRALGFVAGVPLLVVSLAVFAVFLFAGRLVSRREALFRRLTVNAFARELLQQAVRVGFVLVGAVIALEILDATAIVAAVAGVAGLAGLAVSFAFRDLAENYIASVLLSLRQPFQADDHVRIEGHEGRVVRLTSRATILIDLDGNHVRIPNAAVFKGILLNYSRNPQRRFGFVVGVASDTNLAAAVALGVERLASMPGIVAEPAPAGWVEELADWSVVLRFSSWIDQRETHWFKARGEAMRLVKEAFDDAGIVMPEPMLGVRGVAASSPASEASVDSGAAVPGVAEPETAAPDISSDDEIMAAVERDRTRAADDLLDEERPLE